MYQIIKSENAINKLEKKSFSQLKFKEREHLQEWIAKEPNCLGEDLLIIQKEFSGFSDTNERLDLLALDKLGNLVIIENKLDDSGKDVTWQVIKYASYCSSFSTNEIIKIYQDYLGTGSDAKEKLSEFFDNKDISEIILNPGTNTQRLILVAANFRKEVTSSVLWLMNFKIRLQCFKVTPYALNDQLFLSVEQILPTKDAEDFSISLASKAQEEVEKQETLKSSQQIRIRFWERLVASNGTVNNLYSNNSPTKESWMGKGMGMSGMNLNLGISNSYCRIEIYINRGVKEENKTIFDAIYAHKESIEKAFGEQLVWERMDENVTSRIKYQLDGVSYFNEEDWTKMIDFMLKYSFLMDLAFKDVIKKVSGQLKKL